MGLARAFLSCMSKICSLLMRLLRLGGLLAQSAVLLCPFMFAVLSFPALLRGWASFDTGLYISSSLFLDCHHVLSYYSVIPAVMT